MASELEEIHVSCGVPQGSILGPLWFHVYINDISYASDALSLVVFADDTNAFISGDNLDNLVDQTNNEMLKIARWLKANKLTINVSKTKYNSFKTKNKQAVTDKSVGIGNEQLERVRCTRFLGVYINENLSWVDHIAHLRKKISRGIGIICKARRLLSKEACLTLYHSFIFPFLSYCVEVWGGTFVTHLHPLLVLQKRAVRLLTNSHSRTHAAPLFLQLKILPLQQIYEFFLSKFVFRFHAHLLPRPFHDFFIQNYQIHTIRTRNIHKFQIPKFRLTVSQHSVRFMGAKLYNQLNGVLKFNTITSISLFKKKMKFYLYNSLPT